LPRSRVRVIQRWFDSPAETAEVSVNFYDGPDVHRILVNDQIRTRAFKESIAATVSNGDVVLDVGAGSGILSLFAAQAGARRVYALERAPGAAAIARQVVAANGLTGVVDVIEADAEAARLPEPVDVLVSEWLGCYGVDENMLAPVLTARDRWLKPGGRMIPSVVTAWLAPVHHEAARDAIAFRTQPYGLDLSALAPFSLDEAVWLPAGVAESDLRARPEPLWSIDCRTMPAGEARTPYAAELTFRLTGEGVNGVVAWFSAEMPGTGALTNAPGTPRTHWGQLLFPLTSATAAHEGDELHVGFHNVPWGSFGSQHIWACRVADRPLEVHDTRRGVRAAGAPPWRVYQPS
jgi:precorrin-6B methylase 2